VLGVSTAAEDVDVVVRAAGLARVERARREPARGRPAGSVAHHGLAGELSPRKRHTGSARPDVSRCSKICVRPTGDFFPVLFLHVDNDVDI